MGFHLGAGQGQGERPESQTQTNYYNSRVGAKILPGEAVRTGDAGGPNVAGSSREAVKQQVLSSLREDPEPLTEQVLPRKQREHAREYIELIHANR